MDTSIFRFRLDNLIVFALAAGLSFLWFGSTAIPALGSGFDFDSVADFVDGFQLIAPGFASGSVVDIVSGNYTSVEDPLLLALCLDFVLLLHLLMDF